AYAFLWADRTLMFRALEGLEAHVCVDVVQPFMGDDGWTIDTGFDGATGDRVLGKRFLRDIYTGADPRATGRVTVPVRWDRERRQIVSNESAAIIRMFNSAYYCNTGYR